MESVLDRRVCKLEQNELGLYDLVIREGKRVLTEYRNITLERAAVEIENHMYCRGHADE